MGIEIVSVGGYVPETIVRNEDLAMLGFDSQWITRRTGILERRRASSDQAASDLAVKAAQECLVRAGKRLILLHSIYYRIIPKIETPKPRLAIPDRHASQNRQKLVEPIVATYAGVEPYADHVWQPGKIGEITQVAW